MEFNTNLIYQEKKKQIASVFAENTESDDSKPVSVDFVLAICYSKKGDLREINLYLENPEVKVL